MPAKDALEYVIYNDSALCTGSYILNNIFPTLYDAAVFLNLFFKIGKLVHVLAHVYQLYCFGISLRHYTLNLAGGQPQVHRCSR